MSTTNRGWLRKMAEAGRLYVRCRHHLTDDYRWDAANDFGRMPDFMRVRLRGKYKEPPDGTPRDVAEHMWRTFCDAERELSRGFVELRAGDFRSASGLAWNDGDKAKGTLLIHSNLSYDYEVR